MNAEGPPEVWVGKGIFEGEGEELHYEDLLQVSDAAGATPLTYERMHYHERLVRYQT